MITLSSMCTSRPEVTAYTFIIIAFYGCKSKIFAIESKL
jgi:hypothetical protein